MKGFQKTNVKDVARAELHNELGLTGAEVSVNALPAGACVPFIHSHKHNEEIYGVLCGAGKIVVNGEEVEISAGDWFKVAPEVKRQIFASSEGIKYICIQVKEGSLGGFTADDAVIG